MKNIEKRTKFKEQCYFLGFFYCFMKETIILCITEQNNNKKTGNIIVVRENGVTDIYLYRCSFVLCLTGLPLL